MPRDLPPTLAELESLVAYAERRVALQKRRIYAGGGNQARLAELERIHAGATKRLAQEKRRRRSAAADRPAAP